MKIDLATIITIVVTVGGACWFLSSQLGDIRSDISKFSQMAETTKTDVVEVRAKAAQNGERLSALEAVSGLK